MTQKTLCSPLQAREFF